MEMGSAGCGHRMSYLVGSWGRRGSCPWVVIVDREVAESCSSVKKQI
jgi:hypothetical protein